MRWKVSFIVNAPGGSSPEDEQLVREAMLDLQFAHDPHLPPIEAGSIEVSQHIPGVICAYGDERENDIYTILDRFQQEVQEQPAYKDWTWDRVNTLVIQIKEAIRAREVGR